MEGRIAAIYGVVLGSISLILLAAMLWLRTKVPQVHDLYNTVFGGSRPTKPEDTDTFLLGFPTFCCLTSLISPIVFWRSLREDDEHIVGKLIFPIGVFLFFAIGTVTRFVAARHFFGV